MTHRRETAGRQLGTLQRLRKLELQQARVQRAAADAATERQQQRVNDIEAQLCETRQFAASHMTGTQGASAELLRICTEYAKWQTKALSEQDAELHRRQDISGQAREQVLACFEQLCVIERLRERRRREHATETARADQTTLDDRAMIVESRRLSHHPDFKE